MNISKKILKFNILLFIVAFLSACNGNAIELKDGDRHITKEMHEVISNYIIEHYSSSYGSTEKQFEVHKIYGTSESDGVLNVYMWSYYCGFNKRTGTEEQAGHLSPAVIKLKEEEERYSVIKYIEPQDGSGYLPSLKKMFPEKYLKLVQQDRGNIKDLQKEMETKVKKWLGE